MKNTLPFEYISRLKRTKSSKCNNTSPLLICFSYQVINSFRKFPNFKQHNDDVSCYMLFSHVSRDLTCDLIKTKQKCRMSERKMIELFKIAVFIPGIWK